LKIKANGKKASITRVLFSQNPPEKMNSPIMSREDKWIVRETTSDLFNMLWTWLVAEVEFLNWIVK
jgi:hypothetical protein